MNDCSSKIHCCESHIHCCKMEKHNCKNTNTNTKTCITTTTPTNIQMMQLFTLKDEKEGNVGIGKLPNETFCVLDSMLKDYFDAIPDKSNTTHHAYYTDLQGEIKSNFDKIQCNELWNQVCHEKHSIMKPVIEMNEIYYSNPKPNFEKTNLYGASANLIPHRDCILFNFPKIRFYRIIIGVTGNNDDTITEFVNLKMEHKINRGDYMIFDFDRTLHRVKKQGQQDTPRVLLKLHFIVHESDESDTYAKEYMDFVCHFYKYYYYVARYTEQIGTDPTTFMGFFYGLMWGLPFYPEFKYVLLLLLLTVSLPKICMIYMSIVSFCYFRYKLFDVR